MRLFYDTIPLVYNVSLSQTATKPFHYLRAGLIYNSFVLQSTENEAWVRFYTLDGFSEYNPVIK